MAKHTRLPFHNSISSSTRPLELIHTDVCGPAPTASLSHSHYYVVFVDDFTRYPWIYFRKHKSDVYNTFVSLNLMIENLLSQCISILQSDGGGEYISQAPLRDNGPWIRWWASVSRNEVSRPADDIMVWQGVSLLPLFVPYVPGHHCLSLLLLLAWYGACSLVFLVTPLHLHMSDWLTHIYKVCTSRRYEEDFEFAYCIGSVLYMMV